MIDLDPFILQENNRPLDDFQGLTPAEMHCLLYQPLSDNCVVRLKPSIADDVLDQIPFFRLLEDFMTLIENNRGGREIDPNRRASKVCIGRVIW